MVEWLFLAVPWGCLRFVIVVFPDHTHLLFLQNYMQDFHTNICERFENNYFLDVQSSIAFSYTSAYLKCYGCERLGITIMIKCTVNFFA